MGKDKSSKPLKNSKDRGKTKAPANAKPESKAVLKIKVRHILCEKHAKILQAQQQLQAGSHFDHVAKEFSEDKARSGGDLGWKLRTDLVQQFSDVAFNLPKSSTKTPICSSLVKTKFGYHIIMVEDKA